MKKMLMIFILIMAAGYGREQPIRQRQLYHYSPLFYGPDSFSRHLIHNTLPLRLSHTKTSMDSTKPVSLLIEMGFILVMECALYGLSYLASRNSRWRPAIAGGFDVVMGVAGMLNAQNPAYSDSFAYFILVSAFFAKAIYNFMPAEFHSPKARFRTNFIGLNILVFMGCYLDCLK